MFCTGYVNLRQFAGIVVALHVQSQTQLPQAALARSPPRFLLGGGERRQQKGREDGKDGKDHQELDQYETGAGGSQGPVAFATSRSRASQGPWSRKERNSFHRRGGSELEGKRVE